MRDSTLEILAPLLKVLRGHPTLHEIRPATFHLKGRNFVHFHEEPEGVFADVLLAKGRVHMPVSSPTEQAELLQRIDQTLDSLERHERQREGRGRGRRR
jgi:hypothetical protein